MKNPIKCPKCPKVLCDNINNSEVIVTTSTGDNEGIHLVVLCNWCKSKYSLIIK